MSAAIGESEGSLVSTVPAVKQPHKWAHLPWWGAVKDIAGGTMGGMGLVFIGHPFDTMKVRLQTQPVENPMYHGLVDCVKKTYRLEGIPGFYKGVLSPLAGQMFLNATQFFAWGQSIRFVTKGTDKTLQDLTVKDYAIAGVMTGVSCALVECPIDFFKSQLQTQIWKEVPLYRTIPEAVKVVLKAKGIRGPFQGLSATIIRNMPFRSIYFGTYEISVNALTPAGQTRGSLPIPTLLVAGGMAGLMQWVLCYPLDVIKSNMQADSIHKSERQYKGWVDTVRKLYAKGGAKSFFRGFTPCVMRSFPANSACFLLYEQTLKFMDQAFE